MSVPEIYNLLKLAFTSFENWKCLSIKSMGKRLTLSMQKKSVF